MDDRPTLGSGYVRRVRMHRIVTILYLGFPNRFDHVVLADVFDDNVNARNPKGAPTRRRTGFDRVNMVSVDAQVILRVGRIRYANPMSHSIMVLSEQNVVIGVNPLKSP